jgi:hypothetical protein
MKKTSGRIKKSAILRGMPETAVPGQKTLQKKRSFHLKKCFSELYFHCIEEKKGFSSCDSQNHPLLLAQR